MVQRLGGLSLAAVLMVLPVVLLVAVGCAPTTPSAGGEGRPTGATALPWQSGGLKVGYIRSDIITKEYSEYRDANLALRNDNQKWLEEAQRMEQELSRKQAELDELALILSDERKQQLEEEIKDQRRDLQKFRNDTWYTENSEYVKRRRELVEPIDAKVNDAIWSVAESRGLDIVFDTVAGNIVYVKPALDITQEVIEELKK